MGSRLMNLTHRTISIAALVACASIGCSQDPQDLRRQINDVEPVGDWNYDDLELGMQTAAETGKPLLVVFRCVP